MQAKTALRRTDVGEEVMYTFDSRVRYSELDASGKLAIGSIVNYFQDCSTFQAEELGMGLSYLKEQKKVWVLSYWQIVISSHPRLCDRIRIGTQPYELKGFLGLRNFWIEKEDGDRCVAANSIWTLLDTETGLPARATDKMLEGYLPGPRLDMEYAPRRVVPEGRRREGVPFEAGSHHLDSNGHVNNAQYIQMAVDCLPEPFEISQVRAEYKKQALLHDRICPVIWEDPGKVCVSLNGEDGNPFAVVEMRKRWREEG